MLQQRQSSLKIDTNITNKLRIAIVRTDYYEELNLNLEKHCISTLVKYGVNKNNIKTFIAPGSWEIPLIAQAIAKSKIYDAIIAFGVIIKGQTYHFEFIASECARGLMQLSLDYSIPIAIEILAVYNIDQAKERASDNEKNKGIEGALAVLKSIKSLREMDSKI